MLGVAVSRGLTSGTIWQLRGWWVDDLDWSDILIIVPCALSGDDHVIVVNQSWVVLWMSGLGADALLLTLAVEWDGTGTSLEVVGWLLAVSGAHDLVGVDDWTTAEVGASGAFQWNLKVETYSNWSKMVKRSQSAKYFQKTVTNYRKVAIISWKKVVNGQKWSKTILSKFSKMVYLMGELTVNGILATNDGWGWGS